MAVAGQIYSENLGDRAIMVCAEDILLSCVDVAAVHRIDLGGRGYNREKRTGSPGFLLRIHRWAYSRVVRYGSFINSLLFCARRRRLVRAFSLQIEKSDAIVIGGGQLLQHSRLQFPLLLREIVRLSEAAKKPVVFWGVGVGSYWTRHSKEIIRQALRSSCVKMVYVRDEHSHQRLLTQFPDLRMKSTYTCDLAMAISSVIEASPNKKRVIGVAPISPNAVARVMKRSRFAEHITARSFWVDVCMGIMESGYTLRLFTTGTNEDLSFSREIMELIGVSEETFIEHPATVEEFCEIVSGLEAAITGRLHASILAMSYNKPFQGALWESKVVGISHSTGRRESFFGEDVGAKRVVERLLTSISSSRHNGQVNKKAEQVQMVHKMAHDIIRELQGS